MGPGVTIDTAHIDERAKVLGGTMAVTRAEKEQELQDLSAAFKAADTAIVVDYKGLNVPQVTDLRRQLRGAQGAVQGRQEHAGQAREQGHQLASLEAHFEGTTAIAYTSDDAVVLAKALTAFMKGAPALKVKAAVVQGQAIKPARGHRPRQPAGQAGAVREAAVRAAGADAAVRVGAGGNAARPDVGARAGREEEE